jgi:hypothetical protein
MRSIALSSLRGQPAAVGGFGLDDYVQHISKIRYWQFISRNENLLLMASGKLPEQLRPTR